MNSRSSLVPSPELGAALPLIAILAAAIMGFAALAVDVGQVTNERRQDQSAADASALAAAQELGDDPTLVATAIDFASRNAGGPDFDGTDFDSCDPNDAPPRFTALTNTSCVAVDESGTQVRVQLPVRSADTVFGKVIGIDSFDHAATATAGIVSLGYGNVLPLGLPNGATGDVCLKIGSGNVPDPTCNDSLSGNFAFIDFGFHSNVLLNTAEDCSGQGKNGRLANNLALGLDHDISVFGGSPHNSNPVYDMVGSNCNGPYPNGTDTVTGNIPSAFGLGLFAGDAYSDGDPARLQRPGPDWGSGSITTSIAGKDLDDVPFFEYIGDLTGKDVPASCHRSQFVGPDDTFGTSDDLDELTTAVAQHVTSATPQDRVVTLIDRCLAHYRGEAWTDDGAFVDTSVNPPAGEAVVGCDGGVDALACEDPVLTRDTAADVENDLVDIQYSPRFAYIPELDTNDPNGTTTVHFVDIQPVFLQRVYGGNCSSSGCDISFDPGFGTTYAGSTDKAFALTSFVIPDDMLPNGLGDPSAAYELGKNRFIQLVG